MKRICLTLTDEEIDALFGMLLVCDLSDQEGPNAVKLHDRLLEDLDLDLCAPITRKLLAATEESGNPQRRCASGTFSRKARSE